MKLMIHFLKQTSKQQGQEDFVNQLNVINNIRREIVQSSNGVLNNARFQNIQKRMRTVC